MKNMQKPDFTLDDNSLPKNTLLLHNIIIDRYLHKLAS